jgi:hypothetical protein
MTVFEDLFVLFAMSSSKKLLKEHIHLIVTHSTLPAVPFLSKFFMEEGLFFALLVCCMISSHFLL